MKEALFYEKKEGEKVQCGLCNRHCIISPGITGFCRVRKNVNGRLYSLVYNKTLTLTVDPIEKKPIYNFMPGTYCNGVSTYGCNFRCLFCQNYHISQEFTEKMIEGIQETTPEEIVQDTVEKGIEGIAYTYVEPTIFAEYALDTMKLAKKEGLYNVWVSNGYMTTEAIEELSKYMDAINIDLKGDNKFYEEMCGNAELKHVKNSIKRFHKKGIHVEVTNLIVPGFNDNEEHLREIVGFIASIDKGIPLHFSRFFPHYKMLDTPITPAETLRKALKIAKEKDLFYVYLGNFEEAQDTFCPKCRKKLIERQGYKTLLLGLDEKGKCAFCGTSTGIKMPKTTE